MKIDHDLIEDLLKFGGTALNHLFEAKHGAKSALRSQFEVFAEHLDLVTRDEFDTAFAMLKKARLMQDELSDRLHIIEKHLGLRDSKKTSKAGAEMILKLKKEKSAQKKRLPSVKHSNRKRTVK